VLFHPAGIRSHVNVLFSGHFGISPDTIICFWSGLEPKVHCASRAPNTWTELNWKHEWRWRSFRPYWSASIWVRQSNTSFRPLPRLDFPHIVFPRWGEIRLVRWLTTELSINAPLNSTPYKVAKKGDYRDSWTQISFFSSWYPKLSYNLP
jgi:hypothetical protein